MAKGQHLLAWGLSMFLDQGLLAMLPGHASSGLPRDELTASVNDYPFLAASVARGGQTPARRQNVYDMLAVASGLVVSQLFTWQATNALVSQHGELPAFNGQHFQEFVFYARGFIVDFVIQSLSY